MSNPAEPAPRLSPPTKAWRFLRLLLRPRVARKIGTLVTEGYLVESGWVRSVLTGTIVGREGEPIPWMTRPFVDFIGPRLHGGLRVFEYGSGASTGFFASRVREVVAVEHDPVFAQALQPRLPGNARLLLRPASSPAYVLAVTEMTPKPDVVSVDGLDRIACAEAALAVMSASAVLVLDDSQLPEYQPIYAAARAAGFRALDFWGLAAGRVEHRSTTVFYRSDNVLEL